MLVGVLPLTSPSVGMTLIIMIIVCLFLPCFIIDFCAFKQAQKQFDSCLVKLVSDQSLMIGPVSSTLQFMREPALG